MEDRELHRTNERETDRNGANRQLDHKMRNEPNGKHTEREMSQEQAKTKRPTQLHSGTSIVEMEN